MRLIASPFVLFPGLVSGWVVVESVMEAVVAVFEVDSKVADGVTFADVQVGSLLEARFAS